MFKFSVCRDVILEKDLKRNIAPLGPISFLLQSIQGAVIDGLKLIEAE